MYRERVCERERERERKRERKRERERPMYVNKRFVTLVPPVSPK